MIKWLLAGLLVSGSAWADLPKTGNNKFSVTIEKSCEGYSLEDAKQACFESAIEHVVGQVVLSDRVVLDNDLIKYEVSQYSAGYINDYRILKQEQDQVGWYHLTMLMDVASSKIAQRMLTSASTEESINGTKLRDTLISRLDERKDGDTLLGQVISGYPEQAYVINSGETEIKISNQRRSFIDIPFNITMSQSWIKAFDEALGLVSVDSSTCNSIELRTSENIKTGYAGKYVKSMATNYCSDQPDIRVTYKDGFWSTVNSYFLSDQITSEIINSQIKTPMGQQHIGLQVDLISRNGQLLDSRCTNINNEVFIQYDRPRGAYNLRDMNQLGRPVINAENNVYGTLRVDIKNISKLEQLSTVKLSINQTCN